MSRSATVAALLLVLAAVAACRKDAPAKPQPQQQPQALPATPAPVDASVDMVTQASDVAWDGADAGADVAVADGRVLTVAKPFWGGDGARDAPVFVARGDDADDLIERALDGIGFTKVPAGRTVLIKVNLGGFDRMKPGKPDDGVAGRITDPAIVRALVKALRKRGAGEIVVADGRSAPGEEWPALLELSGYAALLEELGLSFVDLNHYGEAAGDARPPPWQIAAPWAVQLKNELVLSAALVDPDARRRPFIVDVAKLKAHRFAAMSLSIKNLMGAVMIVGDEKSPQWKRRWRMHRELSPWLQAWKQSKRDDREAYREALRLFSERLADLYGVIAPDLAIVAGLPAVQGDGFAQVVPYGGAGIVIASRNGCYADWVAARFFGLADSDALEREIGARMPPAIAAVAARYFGGAEGLARVKVIGDVYLPEAGQGAWLKGMAPFEIGARPAAPPP